MGEMTRLLYVDDSGNADYGLIVYGWVEVTPEAWRRGLRAWLNMRKELFTEYRVHVSTELHCCKYIQGRGEITDAPPDRLIDGDGNVLWKNLGQEVAERCLKLVRDCPDIRVGAVHRWTSAKGRQYADERHEVYAALIELLDGQLRASDSYGFVTMDGQERRYREAHRALKLDSRHVIEDPAHHDSEHSQWTQMADLAAYTVNLDLNRHAGNELARAWFPAYLAPKCLRYEV